MVDIFQRKIVLLEATLIVVVISYRNTKYKVRYKKRNLILRSFARRTNPVNCVISCVK